MEVSFPLFYHGFWKKYLRYLQRTLKPNFNLSSLSSTVPFSHFKKKARCAPDSSIFCFFFQRFVLRFACPSNIFCFFFVQRFALQFVFHHALRAFIKRVALHFDVVMFLTRLAHKRLALTASTLAHSATRSRLAPQRRSAAAGGPFSAGPAARFRRGPRLP